MLYAGGLLTHELLVVTRAAFSSRWIPKKMKRNKAAGPDEMPMELLIFLDDGNLKPVMDISWWNSGTFPDTLSRAHVASL